MPSSRLPAPSRSATLSGIGFMLLGVLLFSANDALGKWLVGTFAVGQVVLIRSVAAVLLVAPFAVREGLGPILRPSRPWLQALRASASTLEIAIFYWALIHLSLADVMTFYLAAPIYVTALSALVLKEQVGWFRWTAVGVGFAGVLVILGPSLAGATVPALIAVLGSLLYTVMMVTTRALSDSSGTTLITWQMLGALLFGLVLAPFAWVAPSATDVGLLALLGIVALGAHVCVNQSLRIAPASVVVPYQYTMIVWAIVFGYVFFDDVPTPSLLTGAALIVASGLFIFVREQIRRAPLASTLAATASDTVGPRTRPSGPKGESPRAVRRGER